MTKAQRMSVIGWTFFTLFAVLFTLFWQQGKSRFREKIIDPKTKKDTYSLVDQWKAQSVKDFWISGKEGRVHHRIQSGYSHLFLIPASREKEKKLVEELYDVKGIVQRRVVDFSPCEQHLHLFLAKKGTYDYSTHLFFSESIHFGWTTLEGKELPVEFPLLETCDGMGIAQEAFLSLVASSPELQIKTMRAKISR